jgi:uncharacterized damage-inducible protein DinB
MQARELFIDTFAHTSPLAALEQLTPEQAARRPDGVAHSIADLVAHMTFWQNWFCDRCDGIAAPLAAHAPDGWPAPGSWSDVHAAFTRGVDRAVALGARADDLIAPPIEFPPLARYTVRDALVHMALHNSHHTGQVILLRQMMGLWPPPSGGLTW